MRLEFESDAIVVIAGLPGAGKTTLIRRAVDRAAVHVVDTDDRRDAIPFPVPSGLLHAEHLLRVAAAARHPRPTVVHSRGTNRAQRRLVLLLARTRRRPAHLVVLHADVPEAEQGQRARGRSVRHRLTQRESGRWRAMIESGALGREGWESLVFLDRPEAAEVDALAFRA